MIRKTVLCSGADAVEQHEWLRARARSSAPPLSISLFAGAPGIDRLAPVSLRVRPCTEDDLGALLWIVSLAFGIATSADEAMYEAIVRRYPAGTFCVEQDRDVVGLLLGFPTRRDRWARPHTRADVVDEGQLRGFDLEGDALYVVDCAVHPDHRRSNLEGLMTRAAAASAAQRGLRCILGASRMAGYPRAGHGRSPEDYAREVIAGRVEDPTLTPALRAGYRPLEPSFLVPGYYDDEARSEEHGVLMQIDTGSPSA
jgi:ribosomal protein S18 acetylase RimI-like enzyme